MNQLALNIYSKFIKFKRFLVGLKYLCSFLLILFLSNYSTLKAATKTLSGNGNLTSGTNWSGGTLPAATGDIIVINTGCTLTVNANGFNFSEIRVNGGGTISFNAGFTVAVSGNVTINYDNANGVTAINVTNGTSALNVTGNIIINPPGNNNTNTLAIGAASVSCAAITASSTNASRICAITISTGSITATGYTSSGTQTASNTFAFSGAGSATINGNISGGAFTGNAGTINISGAFAPSSFTANTSTVKYNGTSQNVATFTYYNLTLSGTGSPLLQGTTTVGGNLTMNGSSLNFGFNGFNLTVNNGLTLTSGNIAIGNNNIIVTGPITGGSSSSMILTDGGGYLQKNGSANADFISLYPVGTTVNTSTTYYTPMQITALTATYAGANIQVTAISSSAPNATNTDLNKYWLVSTTGITGINASLSLTYNASEVMGSQGLYVPYLYTAGAWVKPGTASAAGANPLTVSGTTVLSGNWTARELVNPVIKGPITVYTNRNQVYKTDPGMTAYSWTVTGGTVTSGAGTNSIVVTWDNNVGNGTVSVSYTSNGYSVSTGPINVSKISQNLSCFQYRSQVTINSSMVNGGAPLSNFPVLINITDNRLRTVANGGHMAHNNGYDISFSLNSDGSSPLDYQIDYYNGTNGKLAAWVNIPSLSNSANTVVYLFYGNYGISFDASTQSIWSSDYVGVYHLGSSIEDFGRSANDGINGGSDLNSTSLIGQGRHFIRANKDYIKLENEPSFNFTTAQTISFWMWIDSYSPQPWMDFIGKGDNANWRFVTDDANNRMYYAFGTGGTDPANSKVSDLNSATGGLNTGAWYFIAGTFDGTVPLKKLFVNGTSVSQTGATLATNMQTYTINNYPVLIGINSQANDQRAFEGTLDELRISNVKKSDAWILTEYNNQRAGGGYVSVGVESQMYTSSAVGGTSSATPTTIYAREYTTLGISGYTGTIQWQSSVDNISFTDLTGKTAISQPTDPLLTNTYFRAIVTNGGCPAASTVTTVTVNPPYMSCNNAGKRMKITIDESKLTGDDDLIDYPVLVEIPANTYPNLKSIANSGIVQSSLGYDIRFTASDGVTLLPHQVEKYDQTTGYYLAWVQIPIVYATKNTSFFINYGDATYAASNPSTPAVWGSDYIGVYHLGTSGLTDASGHNNDGTNNGTTNNTGGGVNSKIGDASGFAGAQYIDLANESRFDMFTGGQLTVSAWVYATNNTNNVRFIDKNGNTDNSWKLSRDGSGNAIMYQKYPSSTATPAGQFLATNTTGVAQNGWHYVVGTFDHGVNNITAFIDGSASNSTKNDPDNATLTNNSLSVRLGAVAGTASNYFTGRLDEVHIQNIVRSQNWISAEYQNQNSPALGAAANGVFLALGAEEFCASTPPSAGTASANKTILCTGQSATLTLTGYSGGIYWQKSVNGGTTWSYISGANSATLNTGAIFTNTMYRASVSNCCEAFSNTVSITYVNTLPVTITPGYTQPKCNGGNDGAINLGLAGGTSPMTYAWTGPASYSSTLQNIAAIVAGNYSLTLTENNGCISTSNYTLVQPTALSLNITSTDETCSASNNGIVNSTPTGGTTPYSYAWTGPASYTSTSQNIGSLDIGIYNLTVKDANLCPITGSATIATANPSPTITLGTNPSVCQGVTTANLTYSATANSPNQYSIIYSVAAHTAGFVDVNNVALPGSQIPLVVPAAAAVASYTGTLTVTNSITTCGSTSYPISVSVNAVPSVTTASTANTCSGINPNISLTASVSSTFTWTIGAITGGITGASVGSGNTINQILTNPSNTSSGTVKYLVTPTSTATGLCVGAVFTITVTVNPAPNVVITNPTAVCSPSTIDLTSSSITTGSTAGLTYTYWTDAGATLAYATPTIASAGTYYIKGTVVATGCNTIQSVLVTVNNPPSLTIGAANSTCGLTPVTISGVTASNYSAIQWTPIANITNGNTLTPIYTAPSNVDAAISLTITLTANTGCTDASGVKTINVWANPSNSSVKHD